jgi:hypothetical protein
MASPLCKYNIINLPNHIIFWKPQFKWFSPWNDPGISCKIMVIYSWIVLENILNLEVWEPWFKQSYIMWAISVSALGDRSLVAISISIDFQTATNSNQWFLTSVWGDGREIRSSAFLWRPLLLWSLIHVIGHNGIIESPCVHLSHASLQ